MDDPKRCDSRLGRWLRTPGRLLVGVTSSVPLARTNLSAGRVLASAAAVSVIGLLLASAIATTPRLTMEAPANPRANITPIPSFLSSGECSNTNGAWSCRNPCVSATLTWPVFTNDSSCNAYVLEAIDNARAEENLSPMVLPTNWTSLTIPEQMFVITNLERVARGYPPYLGLNAKLDHAAMSAALLEHDPQLASGFAVGFNALGARAWGGSWSEGFDTLAADYVMLYDDGWGGTLDTSNITCTSPTAPGCWSHRDELLGDAPHYNSGVGLWCDTCEFGGGYAIVRGGSSFVQLIELPAGPPPAMVFTWQRELANFPAGAIGSVKTISVARVAFTSSSLRVRWSVAGVQNVSLAALYTFSGSRCTRIGNATPFRYVPTFNILRSTLTVSGPRNFSHRGRYSAVVRIFTPSGSLTSRCVSLGHN
ncbi:MAG: hypothetical protein ABSE75_10390 [Acidimicrobiales bacterium]